MLKNVSKLILSAVLFLCPAVLCLGYPYDSLDIDAPALGKHDGGEGGNQIGGGYFQPTSLKVGVYAHINAMWGSDTNFENANDDGPPLPLLAKGGLSLLPNLGNIATKGGVVIYSAYLRRIIVRGDKIERDDGYWELRNGLSDTKYSPATDANSVLKYRTDYSLPPGTTKGDRFCSATPCFQNRDTARTYVYDIHPLETQYILPYLKRTERTFDLAEELTNDLTLLSSKVSKRTPIIVFFSSEVPVDAGVISINPQNGKNLTYRQVANIARGRNVKVLVMDSCHSFNFDNLEDLSGGKSSNGIEYVIGPPDISISKPVINLTKALGAVGDYWEAGKSEEAMATGIVKGYTGLYRLVAGAYLPSKISIANMGYFAEAKTKLETVLREFAAQINDNNRDDVLKGIYDSVHFYDRFTDKRTPSNSYSGYAADIGSLLAFIQTNFPNLDRLVETAKDRIRGLMSYTSQNKNGSDETNLLNIPLLLPNKLNNGTYCDARRGLNPYVRYIFENKLKVSLQRYWERQTQ